jgi:hypothetical protein
MRLAVTPLTDVYLWARRSGLEIVLFVLGALLLGRALRWLSVRITDRRSHGHCPMSRQA